MPMSEEPNASRLECPITFFARVGKSNGDNVNNARAMKVGLRMTAGILMSWRLLVRE
jgi:hypothetical protein